MFEIGVFHNGASSLPVVITKDGVAVNDGSLAEVHAAAQEVLVNQVRQGILAEKLGYQSFWLTEHHFQPEGAEMSPNPLFTQMAIAAQTRKIRLGQCAKFSNHCRALTRNRASQVLKNNLFRDAVQLHRGAGWQEGEPLFDLFTNLRSRRAGDRAISQIEPKLPM